MFLENWTSISPAALPTLFQHTIVFIENEFRQEISLQFVLRPHLMAFPTEIRVFRFFFDKLFTTVNSSDWKAGYCCVVPSLTFIIMFVAHKRLRRINLAQNDAWLSGAQVPASIQGCDIFFWNLGLLNKIRNASQRLFTAPLPLSMFRTPGIQLLQG